MSKNTNVSSGQQPSLDVDQDNVYDIICKHFPSEWYGFYLSKEHIECALEDLTARGVIPSTTKEDWLTNKRRNPRHGVTMLLSGSNEYVSLFKLKERTFWRYSLNSENPKASGRVWYVLLQNDHQPRWSDVTKYKQWVYEKLVGDGIMDVEGECPQFKIFLIIFLTSALFLPRSKPYQEISHFDVSSGICSYYF